MVAAEAGRDLGLNLAANDPSADRRGGDHQGANGAMRFLLGFFEHSAVQREPKFPRALGCLL